MLFAMVMLVAHALSFSVIKVDSTSIILLIIVCICPYVSAIKKIKFGGFEAEINPEEVKRIKEEVSKQVADSGNKLQNSDLLSAIASVKEIAKSDPTLALAKLWIELEKLLSKLYRGTRKQEQKERYLSIGQLVSQLSNEGILPNDIARSTREVISICNRALHGEDIRQGDAISVIESGGALVSELAFLISENTFGPAEAVEISKPALRDFREARYRIVTVTPLVEHPQKNVRILDQAGLNDFLEDYNDFGEFIVEVTKIETP